MPNVYSNGTTTIWDEHTLMFADIASPQTIQNLRAWMQVASLRSVRKRGRRQLGRSGWWAAGVAQNARDNHAHEDRFPNRGGPSGVLGARGNIPTEE